MQALVGQTAVTLPDTWPRGADAAATTSPTMMPRSTTRSCAMSSPAYLTLLGSPPDPPSPSHATCMRRCQAHLLARHAGMQASVLVSSFLPTYKYASPGSMHAWSLCAAVAMACMSVAEQSWRTCRTQFT